jgi:hypothetical protein
MNDRTVTAYVNGAQVYQITNALHMNGYAGIGSSFNYVRFDDFRVASPSDNLTWIKHDDIYTGLAYTGAWNTYNRLSNVHDSLTGLLYMNTCSYTSAPGASVTYTFTGRKGRFWGITRNDLGTAEVYLDNVKVVSAINMNTPTTFYQVLHYETPLLSYGRHTIKIAAVSGLIIIDAFSHTLD